MSVVANNNKSPLALASGANVNTVHDRASSRSPSRAGAANGSYFPSQQYQLADGEDPETVSNTFANSQIVSPDNENGGSVIAPVAIRPTKFTEEWDASQRGSFVGEAPISSTSLHRSNSYSGSVAGDGNASILRGNTLKKKPSLRRTGSLRRSGSRRSLKAGSVRSLALQSNPDQPDLQSAFVCPVPVTGNPTEVLANRFQVWRKILKDLISYFREIQTHYEHRAKSLLKLANLLNNITTPPGLLPSGGIDDALSILRDYNKQATIEAGKAKEIEEDVILALTGLRSDLQQKIKEIKNLSGDFKNSVQKEMDQTRRAVNSLQETLGQTEMDSALTTGKQDPYLLRLAVDRQLYRQIDEENYLHQAYLNLEKSGRELESIVVGEIQKSYNAYAGILKRESDAARATVHELRAGPIALPKDIEWNDFVRRDDQFVDPDIPPRSAQFIDYPGRDHPLAVEIRAGLLERKSKYLKSYTAGWYVLSPTHLHEFKSADKTQAPLMSLYLPEQKLGSHSAEGGSSNKFVLKGRQTGAMHRGHTWVFRAESRDTMMAWYEDIKALTEKTPEERSNFVRDHSRSYSRSSQRSISSDGAIDDEDDEPFTAAAVVAQQPGQDNLPRRPSPGGRFPSDLQVNAQRGMQVPHSPGSVSSGFDHRDREINAAVVVAPGSAGLRGTQSFGDQHNRIGYGSTARTPMDEAPSHAAILAREAREDGINPYTDEPLPRNSVEYTRAMMAMPNGVPDNSTPRGSGHGGGVDGDRNLEWASGRRGVGDDGSSGQLVGNQPRLSASGSSGQEISNYTTEQAMNEEQISGRGLSGAWGGRQVETNGNIAQNGMTTRPAVIMRNDSGPTLSNLHIPGGFPKGTPVP